MRHAKQPSVRGRRAFSLAELATVVAIIGVTTAIAVPRYATSLARYRADAAARRIVADLALAQATARAQGAGVSVSFDVVNNRYQVVGVSDFDRSSSGYIVKLGNEPYVATLVSATFGTGSQITYDLYGFPGATAGSAVVKVGSVQKTITVSAVTGKGAIQ